MEIYFLTPSQAYPRLTNLHINPGCTRAHYKSIAEFSSEQKTLLLYLMKRLENLLAPYSSSVGKVEFVLLERGVYWDFPFTFGKTMIMMTPKLFEKSRKHILKILAHEWVHLDQRRNTSKYNRYYRTLGFRKQNINFGLLTSYLLRNPDADKYEWIWVSDNGGPVYAPVALLHKCEFSTLLLEIGDPSGAHYGDDTKIIMHMIDEVPAYSERFGTKRQLYHPNEISAHLIADAVVDKVWHVPIDNKQLLELITA